MKTLLTSFMLCALVGGGAFAKAPPGQGKSCKAGAKCESSLQCLKGACQLECKENSGCPEDQRCVADGPKKICRPITDLDL